MEGDDPFCRIARGEEPAYFVYEDDDLMVILDHMPARFAHSLVVTKGHYAAVEDVPPRLLAKAWLVASALARYLRREAGAVGVNVITNSGAPARQVVFHFHVHVIPHWPDEPEPHRHPLTKEEAERALSLLSGSARLIKEYLDSLGAEA